MSELDFEVAQRRSPELIDLCIDSSEEKEVENIGANKEPNFAETTSDLEEGEIKEPEPEKEVCRYFQRGRCWLGKNCNFLHVGINSYKMFDPQIQFNTQNFQHVIVYQPIIINQSTEGPPDAWDRGLNEAKKLLLKAKLKKDSDLDFEEKQLYQGLDEIINERKDLYISNRLGKREKTRSNSRLDTSNRGSNSLKTTVKELSNVRKPGKAKLRRKNSTSNSVSPIPFCRRQSHSPDSSSFSSCSECKVLCKGGHKREKKIRKTKSKLERVFSRTFGSPETLRSRKRTSHNAHLCRRSLSKHSSIKRDLYQSYTKSPSLKNKCLKNRPEKYPPRKPPYKKSILPMPERRTKFERKERSGSPLFKLRSRNYAHNLECFSSDITVSSMRCTSVSTSSISSEAKETISYVSRRISNNEHKRENINARDIKKWLGTVPNVTTKGGGSKSEVPKKVVDKKKEKSTKPVEKDKIPAKINRKLSSSSTTDQELSADELELLKYIPTKNRKKPEQKKIAAIPTPKASVKELSPRKDCVKNKENFSNEMIVKYPPPTLVYDYGTDTEDPSLKLIYDYESDRHSSSQKSAGSKKADPTPITFKEDLSKKNILDHETNGENQLPNESNIEEEQVDEIWEKLEGAMQVKCLPTKEIADVDIPKQLDESRVEPKNDSLHTNKSKSRRSSSDSSYERPFSKEELELLKYVCIGTPLASKTIRKQKKKNISTSDDKKTKQITMSGSDDIKNSPKLNSAEQKKVKNTTTSRREQLMQQLEAVELAIAEKKKQAKLEYAKLRRRKLSEK